MPNQNPAKNTAANSQTNNQTSGQSITATTTEISLEELLRTSPSILAFDPSVRAQFMEKVEAMDEVQKQSLKKVLLEERETMSHLDQEEALAKAKAREKIVSNFEVQATTMVHTFERSILHEKAAPQEQKDQAEANNLLQKL